MRAAKLMEGPLPAGQAAGLIAGAVVTALVRDAYTVEHLTTADNWRNSIALLPGAVMPPGIKMERVLHGAAVACRPREWASEDFVEVAVQLRLGTRTAQVRAKGRCGMAGWVLCAMRQEHLRHEQSPHLRGRVGCSHILTPREKQESMNP